jgi:hypothetical protein
MRPESFSINPATVSIACSASAVVVIVVMMRSGPAA